VSQKRQYSHVFSLPFERHEVFALFADPRHLDLLTPPWFRLAPREPLPAKPVPGVEIRYRLRWRGIPWRWTSLITEWREPDFFAYEQKRGPYRYFRHEHAFTSTTSGTEICDRVLFHGPAGALADRLIALPDLRRIFAYRERIASSVLASQTRALDHLVASGGSRPPAHHRRASRMPRTSASSSPIERPT
jgi:ligand-binding SRPBCC domain-containing protein